MDENLDLLIEMVNSGDESALVELFERHRERLQRMVNLRMDRRIQARVAVSDILQEAYVDLARQLPNYVRDPKLPFFLWMRRITGQRLAKIHRMHLGQQKRIVTRDVPLERCGVPESSSLFMAAELVDQFTSAAGQAIREELILKVQEVLEAMPAGDQEIISLRHVEQLSNSEVAHVLEISPKAASMRYTRAILRLKDALEKIPGMLD